MTDDTTTPQLTVLLNGGELFDDNFTHAKIEIEKANGEVFNLETGKKKPSFWEQAAQQTGQAIGGPPDRRKHPRPEKPRLVKPEEPVVDPGGEPE